MIEIRPLIVVFGSNLQGIHGAGAAREAVEKWGAKHGCFHGISGRSFALPTKRTPYQSLTVDEIREYVETLFVAATWSDGPDCDFLVTRVGCGLAGFRDEQIAPLFAEAPLNCILPVQWREWRDAPGRRWHDEGTILQEVTP